MVCGCASVGVSVGAYPSECVCVYGCMCVVYGMVCGCASVGVGVGAYLVSVYVCMCVCVLFMVWCVGVHQWVWVWVHILVSVHVCNACLKGMETWCCQSSRTLHQSLCIW